MHILQSTLTSILAIMSVLRISIDGLVALNRRKVNKYMIQAYMAAASVIDAIIIVFIVFPVCWNYIEL